GKYLPAHSHRHHTMTERIEHIGDIGIDVGKYLFALISHTGDFTYEIFRALRHPSKIRWRETLYYMDVCGADALPIVSVICFLMGLILGFQGAIQLHKIGTDIYLADGVGLSIVKELGPLMVAMIATGRAGSAFAAEIGTMKVGEEISAMTTFGFVPSRFLFIPKLIAMVAVMPLLTVFGDFIGIAGGLAVGYFKLGIPIMPYINRSLAAIQNIHLAESLAKSVVFAVLITIVGCVKGFESDGDAQGVGRAATSAVVTSIFLIVVADTVLTFFFSFTQ
ncbi:MAG: ABC transporter permease, partial [Victivallales bacterium]|nr:ABC transporter permease [Victivallales bacterium]